MNKRYLTGVLLVFVLADLVFTYWQNYLLPLDGDMVAVTFPSPFYSQVLQDPFGWTVLTKNAVYAAPNRFFAHASVYYYWRYVPLLLHAVVDPISSMYAASALFTTVMQASFLLLLALYIRRASGEPRGWLGFGVAAALLAPLFQRHGYYQQLGLHDLSITYTFFYALPLVLVLVLLWPFFRAACQRQPLRLSWPAQLALVGLMVVIGFHGVIATAALAVVLFCIGLYWAWGQVQAWRHPQAASAATQWLSGQAIGLLAVLALICLYSIYIGRNNIENTHDHTLGELFRLLPTGVYEYFLAQPALPMLTGLLVLNAQLLRRLPEAAPGRQRALQLLRWVGVYTIFYLLLLPFGGYRIYRPYLLRNDSIAPILVGLFFVYGVSSYVLLFQLRGRWHTVYLVVICLFSALLMGADARLKLADNNSDCQRWALDQLARATEPIVELSTYCNVLTWLPFTEYHQSEIHAQMFYYWGITPREQLYYQKAVK